MRSLPRRSCCAHSQACHQMTPIRGFGSTMQRQFEEIDPMKKMAALLAFLVSLSCGGMAQAQDAQTASTIPLVLNHNIAGVESEFVPAAEAMPEEKYAF